jgi:hypothetical protein
LPILNVHAPTEDNIDVLKDGFYEELENNSKISLVPYQLSISEYFNMSCI